MTSRDLIRRFYEELWNPFDKRQAAALLTDDVRFRGSLGQEKRGCAGFIEYMDFIAAAFPDFTNHVEEIIAEGDRAFARLTYRGTHRGACRRRADECGLWCFLSWSGGPPRHAELVRAGHRRRQHRQRLRCGGGGASCQPPGGPPGGASLTSETSACVSPTSTASRA